MAYINILINNIIFLTLYFNFVQLKIIYK